MTFASSKLSKLLPTATLSMAVAFLVSMSDAVICGNITGESGLAAINLMQGVFEIENFLSVLIVNGAGFLFSIESGAYHLRRAKGYFTLGLIATIVISMLTTTVFAIVRIPVLKSFGVSQEVFEAAAGYWLWYLPYVIFAPVSRYLTMMCSADGNARLSFVAYLAQLIGNLVVSIPCTFMFGVKGCAMGTWTGAIFSLVVILFHFRRKSCTLGFCSHFRVTDVFRIIQNSIGDAGKNVGRAVLFFTLNAFVIAKFGSDSLPVLAVVVMTIGMSDVFEGIGNAIHPLIGVYVGEKNTFLMRRIMGTSVKVALCEGGGVALLLAVFPQLMLKLAGVDSPEIVPQAALAVRLVSVSLVGLAVVLTFNSYYNFIGYDALPAVMTLLAVCVCPLVLSVSAGALFGINGMWIALGLAPLAAFAMVSVYMVRKYGMQKFPLLLEHEREKKLRVFDLALTPEEICAASRDVDDHLRACGISGDRASRAALLVEETLMVVRDRNAGKKVLGEITVDLNDDRVHLVLRDDGEIFNITDADARISSLRVYLVSNLMTQIPNRRNLITTGFNRNTFRL